MNYHLVKYIESFLIECECCHKLDLFSIENKCCICKKYKCSKCEKYTKVYGFICSNYCSFCYYYCNEFVT